MTQNPFFSIIASLALQSDLGSKVQNGWSFISKLQWKI
jgi:hypothetical protein